MLSTALLASLEAIDSDWRLIPCDDRKRPVDPTTGHPLDDWVSHAATLDEIAGTAASPHVHALGLVLGPISGVLAVDFDGTGSTATFREVFGRPQSDLPPTPAWSSGRPNRRQLAFRVPFEYWPHLRGRRFWQRDGRTVLELRWAGHQSVIAGAHPDTAGYHWIPNRSPADLQVADAPDWLLEPLIKPPTESPDTDYEPSAGDAQRALELLQHIQPRDDYDSWLSIGMALHSADPGLLDAWVSWSQGCSNFNEDECRAKWPSFKGRGITTGTLHWFASQDGYIAPAAPEFEWNPPDDLLDAEPQGQQQTPDTATTDTLTEEIEHARERLQQQLANLDASINLALILPPRLAQALISKAESMSADPSAFLGPLLTAAASVVGTRARVVVNPGWSEPFVIWAGNILPPSAMKSPILGAIAEPLVARQQAGLKDHLEELRQLRRDGEKDPDIPPPRRWLVSDATYERLAQICAEPRTYGIWSQQDELAGWFERLDARQSAGARAGWLSLWGGGAALIDRKVAASSMATRSAVSLFGNVQPERLLNMIEAQGDDAAAAGDGLWARFLWCRPPQRVWSYNPNGLSIYTYLSSLVASLDGVPQSLQSEDDPNAIGFEVRLPHEVVMELAAPTWETWAQDAIGSTPARAAFLGKLRGYSCRLMGILQMIELAESAHMAGCPLSTMCECDPTTGAWFIEVSPAMVGYGLLLSDWYRAQFDAISTELGSSELRAPVARFLRLVRESGRQEVTPRDVITWRVFGRQKIDSAMALRFLRQLVEVYGHGAMKTGRRKGSMVWVADEQQEVAA
jgi:hypothetical protein